MKKDKIELPFDRFPVAPKYVTVLPCGESMTYRPFLVKEERLLLLAAESKDENKIMEQVIESCTFGKLKSSKYSYEDMVWLLLQLKIKSKGDLTELTAVCKNEIDGVECSHKNSVTFNLSDAIVSKGEIKDRTIKLNESNGLKIKPITIRDSLRIDKIDDDNEQVFERIYASIEMFYFGDDIYLAKDVKKESIEQYVDMLSNTDLVSISDAIKTLPHISVPVSFKCAKCGYTEDISIGKVHDFLE